MDRHFLMLLLLFVLHPVSNCEDQYEERLYVQKKPGAYSFDFQFTTRWWQFLSEDESFNWNHFHLFPKQLGQLVQKYQIHELHLAFSKGEWLQEKWGPQHNPGPSGVELWGIYKDEKIQSEYGTEDAWTRITRHASGIFCASLGQLGGNHAAKPLLMFRDRVSTNYTMSYGQLPDETFCTENLTPWLKLLPTRGNSGLASLLVPTSVFSSLHHTMSSHFRRLCVANSTDAVVSGPEWENCHEKVVELIQSFTIVFEDTKPANPLQLLVANKKAIPTILQPSSVASESTLFLEIPTSILKPLIVNDAINLITTNENANQNNLVSIDLKKVNWSDSYISSLFNKISSASFSENIIIERAAYGIGQVYGGIVCHMNAEIPVLKGPKLLMAEVIPPYLRVIPSTISLALDGVYVTTSAKFRYQFSAFDRTPTLLEYEIMIPESKRIFNITFRYEFHKVFQKLSDFPPDANRGFDVPAIFFSVEGELSQTTIDESTLVRMVQSGQSWSIRAYSNVLVISLPLPDFSMPFNVITLSCTIIALFFGSTVNITARRSKPERENESGSLYKRIKKRYARIFSSNPQPTDEK